ncbi:alkylmercury lyase [Natrarchaeobius halalkaliphilus]|uniref:Alkylmercury lyase n=1 Tax=Natrarchaeobius halalkaliphilus TaxID=1679091 RepID=A0A3N6LVA3_9EURY|nr:organomercurial lyase [Natrarchaeobius halalkaliphilus]RQG91604.1 alkylmercury lyase [Natrarchaeobius halalkaliphilus]
MTPRFDGCGGNSGCGCESAGRKNGSADDAERPTPIESEPTGSGSNATEDRWVEDPTDSAATLPEDVQTAMERFLGTEPLETMVDCLPAVRRRVFGDTVDVVDLCHADGETDHRAVLEGETYHFRCFYDVILLAALTSSPVEMRTVAPDGAAVTARVTGTGKPTVSPTSAVASFGIETDVEPLSASDRPLEVSYAAICPHTNAFPSRPEYEAWAATASAATIGMPLANATELAELLLE